MEKNWFNKLFCIKNDWVVFFDLFSPDNNGDSIRPIAEELRKRYPELKFFFCCKKHKKNIDMADEVLVEKSLRFKYVCSRAKYIISNIGFPNDGKKRKGQVFVQTFHGTPLKKLYLSKEKTPKNEKFANIFRGTDIFCASCDFCHKAFREALNIKEEAFLNSGLPRNDILINHSPQYVDDIKSKLMIPQGKKVLFYCPTWRKTDYHYKANLPLDISLMKEKLGNEYCLLIRSHVGKHQWVDSNRKPVQVEDGEFCFNVANWQNISDLYLVSDILITDYSSAMFDFGILEKPQIFYAYDLDEYLKDFGLYFDYKDIVPTEIAYTTDDIINIIKANKDYSANLRRFKETYCRYEKGDATKKVVDEMIKKGKV